MPRLDPFAGTPIEMAPVPANRDLEIPARGTWEAIARQGSVSERNMIYIVNLAQMIAAGRVTMPVLPNGTYFPGPRFED